jgi:DNA-binding CsgD family transcriptional regulator
MTAAKPILTPREAEVLMRLVDGDSVASVAKQLYMSESTVKTHVARVYEKLGAHNRASAIMAAVRLGFVKTDDNWSNPRQSNPTTTD